MEVENKKWFLVKRLETRRKIDEANRLGESRLELPSRREETKVR